MTGKELVKVIRAHRGKVQVRALFGENDAWLFVSKQELIEHFGRNPDAETGVSLVVTDAGDAIIDVET